MEAEEADAEQLPPVRPPPVDRSGWSRAQNDSDGVAVWRWDKRDYETAYPPKHIDMPKWVPPLCLHGCV
jgi:hypothetical protein